MGTPKDMLLLLPGGGVAVCPDGSSRSAAHCVEGSAGAVSRCLGGRYMKLQLGLLVLDILEISFYTIVKEL